MNDNTAAILKNLLAYVDQLGTHTNDKRVRDARLAIAQHGLDIAASGVIGTLHKHGLQGTVLRFEGETVLVHVNRSPEDFPASLCAFTGLNVGAGFWLDWYDAYTIVIGIEKRDDTLTPRPDSRECAAFGSAAYAAFWFGNQDCQNTLAE